MNWTKIVRKVWKRAWQVLLVLLLTLIVLEVSYRYQWIDFYATEFVALNPEINAKKPNVLVFGDSFTAHPNSYVSELRRKHTSHNFINCAVPGSGPYQMEIMAKSRIAEYPPVCVLYQMYVGNDLTDIAPPVNWSTLSFARNCYWSMKPTFEVFGLFSRRISGIQSDFDPSKLKQDSAPFSVSNYSPRTKMMLRGNPNYINKCIQVTAEFNDAMNEAKSCLTYLREITPKKVPVFVVILPHFSQVSQLNNERYALLSGYKTSEKINYKFVREISKVKGVTVLNPMTYFRSMEAIGNEIYYNNDPHLTSRGQEMLFSYIDEKIAHEWQ